MVNSKWVVAMLAATSAHAEIVNSPFWKKHDYTNANLKVQVIDGIAAGTDDTTDQFITSGWPAVGHSDDFADRVNVLRVESVFTEASF